jgi:hypothetical protein
MKYYNIIEEGLSVIFFSTSFFVIFPPGALMQRKHEQGQETVRPMPCMHAGAHSPLNE